MHCRAVPQLRALAAGLLLFFAACQRTAEVGARGAGQGPSGARVGGEVISTVDGTPITSAQVVELMRATSLDKQEALRRLQSELLLAAEAQRRGFDRDPDVVSVGQRALVQHLLAVDVESRVATDAELAEAYQKALDRYVLPERRASFHVVAQLGKMATAEQEQKALTFIEGVIDEFLVSPAPQAVLEKYKSRARDELKVRAEVLPPVANGQGRFDPAYTAALFSRPGVGPVPRAVRTRFGYHAIYVTRILPAEEHPLSEVKGQIRSQVEIKLHKALLRDLLAEARDHHPVARDDEAIAAALDRSD